MLGIPTGFQFYPWNFHVFPCLPLVGFVGLIDYDYCFSANLSVEGYATVLSENPAGVYFGWAKLSNHGFYKMVMSIGWNPYFNNTEKTIVRAIWELYKNLVKS